MIATISMQSQYTGMQDHRHNMASLTANAAGDPLPLIPRRPQTHLIRSPSWPLVLSPHSSPSLSASSSLSPSQDSSKPSILPSASIVTITPATPPKTESDSDTSPQRRGKRRKKDVRVPNPTALHPPELPTPKLTPRTPLFPSFTSILTPILKGSTTINESVEDAPPCAHAVGTRVPLVYTPGMPLRLSIESLKKTPDKSGSLHSIHSLRSPSSLSESLSPSFSLSSVSNASTGSLQASPTSTPLIRKKSGQVVRPSLKSSSSYSTSHSASNLCIMSPNLSFPSSKSAPATPLTATTPSPSKAVHFDENLAQVKLFLTEQKPLAVSREGSPVDTDEGETSASGLENYEITRFFGSISLIGDSSKKPLTKPLTKLLMHTNIPLRSLPLPSSTADVTLETLLLAKGDKSILGSVLVRNIAYDKFVTARFSFDGWCTTSEVNAKWKEGVGSRREGITEWDRFEFVIWLGDLKLGEEKGNSRKLELAVRYRVASRSYEIWDNNGGRNYVATFDRPGPTEKGRGRRAHLKKGTPPVPFLFDEPGDLLEKAATSKPTRKSRSISPTIATPKWMPMSFDRSTSPSPLSTAPCKPAGNHARTRSFPFSASSPRSVQSDGWMETSPPSPPSPLVPAWLGKKAMFDRQEGRAFARASPNRTVPPATPTTLGSPRDLGDDIFHSPIGFSSNDSEEESVDDSGPEGRELGYHQRGCFYFPSKQSNPQEFISEEYVHAPAEPATPTPPPSSRFHSSSLTFRDSAVPRENPQSLLKTDGRVKELPMDPCNSSQSPASFIRQSRTVTHSALPSAVNTNLARQNSDDMSDSSSVSTLLENESPPSSRSSTPPLEEEPGKRRNNDRELYRDFLKRFCFFTGPESPPSLSNARLDDVTNLDESSSESSTPTITPSGSI